MTTDTERLDWLQRLTRDQRVAYVLLEHEATDPPGERDAVVIDRYVDRDAGTRPRGQGADIRAAIDAAMQAFN